MILPIVTYETALLAKSKGFDWKIKKGWCNRYDSTSANSISKMLRSGVELSEITLAPTQALLQMWLRKWFDITIVFVSINPNYEKVYNYMLTDVDGNSTPFKPKIGYELALESALIEALKLLPDAE